MRVLFPLHGFIGWNGGLDLVRLIASALDHSSLDEPVELHFALPETPTARRLLLSALRRWRSLRAGNSRHSANAGSADALRCIASDITAGHSIVTCGDSAAGILQAAVRINADIVFPTMLPLGKSAQPRIGYLFDFQHRHLPHLFSTRMRRNRDRQFTRIAADADGIVVNSQAVARDVRQFLGVSADRVLAMPFTPYAQPWSFDIDPVDAQCRYGVGGRYLMVCNHFWMHKDHATALRAFALLRKNPANANLQLVLTGDPIDHRDPQHYGHMVALGDALGITQHTHFLGLISKRDQLALLRGCAALLQPTLFEGGPGGGSVYDAIGLGVPAIVSDIPVNREINVGQVTFFEAGDFVDLAEKLEKILATNWEPRPSSELMAEGQARLMVLGQTINTFLLGITALA